MLLTKYQTTHLEDFVDSLYLRLKITRPEQLNVEEISAALGIQIELSPFSCSVVCDKSVTIHLNSKLTPLEQWFDFLHELCHFLRHSGNQLNIRAAMRAWQEWDAKNFTLYAAMPFMMLRELYFPVERQAAIELISTTFHVSFEMAHLRYQQILRRVYCALWG
ncbi:ImmA/IrrE family metallo-endopeptidase [Paenibacillus sp. S-38]|uniref:ImmA/IrrE family metallo-endopeptidase n=1 Tax=Paenibacillus sp. S-38 TaxID=3416710 RepID=UPI003CF74DAA